MAISRALSVKQLNMYVKSLLESDENLKKIVVRGEISNFNRNIRSGHAYFTLKDADASVRVVMFHSNISKVRFEPRDGLCVFISGRITLYERDGQYQLYAEQMTPEGIGAEYLAFLQLKEKLDNEGLFDSKYKKELPAYPLRIGLATSKNGAAVHDVCSIIKRRYPLADIFLYPCVVQGEECAASIIRALQFFDKQNCVDLIIITRGGGSYEDLSGFNDEGLARTVFDARTPIISAVGHEVDFTILDFVADVRAATPSAAAEIATPSKEDLINNLMYLKQSSMTAFYHKLETEHQYIDLLYSKINIKQKIRNYTERLNIIKEQIQYQIPLALRVEQKRLTSLIDTINALNPLAVLSRGYTVTYKNKKIITSATMLNPGDKFVLQFKDGVINCAAEGSIDI